MLLSLNYSNKNAIKKLFDYVKINKLDLKILDEDETKPYLPGKELSKTQIINLIVSSRKSGTVSFKKVGKIIREELG